MLADARAAGTYVSTAGAHRGPVLAAWRKDEQEKCNRFNQLQRCLAAKRWRAHSGAYTGLGGGRGPERFLTGISGPECSGKEVRSNLGHTESNGK